MPVSRVYPESVQRQSLFRFLGKTAKDLRDAPSDSHANSPYSCSMCAMTTLCIKDMGT